MKEKSKSKYINEYWKVFPDGWGAVHVCPTDKKGAIILNHILHENCPCEPEKEIYQDGGVIYKHNYIRFN